MVLEEADMDLKLRRRMKLKGGENSHLDADLLGAVDSRGDFLGICYFAKDHDVGARVREPGWTNIGDISACLRTITGLGVMYRHVAMSSKHTRPVGIANGESQFEALIKSLAGDLNSPFGGFFAFNRPVTMEVAEFLGRDDMFYEGIVAPEYEEGTVGLLTGGKDRNENRFLIAYGRASSRELDIFGCSLQPVVGGHFIRQTREPEFNARKECVIVTSQDHDIYTLLSEIVNDIDFAGNAAIYLSSNLVFFVHDGGIVGLGDGCGARTIAAEKARLMLERSAYAAMSRESQGFENMDKFWDIVLYDTPFKKEDFTAVLKKPRKVIGFSDAFYPKLDGFIETAGLDRYQVEFQDRTVRYVERVEGQDVEMVFIPKRNNYIPNYDRNLVPSVVVQPGGSLGDKLVVPMAEKYDVRMVFTMTPEKFGRYQEKGNKGETGRRFFGHIIM